MKGSSGSASGPALGGPTLSALIILLTTPLNTKTFKVHPLEKLKTCFHLLHAPLFKLLVDFHRKLLAYRLATARKEKERDQQEEGSEELLDTAEPGEKERSLRKPHSQSATKRTSEHEKESQTEVERQCRREIEHYNGRGRRTGSQRDSQREQEPDHPNIERKATEQAATERNAESGRRSLQQIRPLEEEVRKPS